MASTKLKDRKYCKGAIACDYMCGDTMDVIRGRYGITSYEIITRAIKPIRGNIEKYRCGRVGKISDEKVSLAIEMYKEGLTQEEIARKLCLNKWSIANRLRQSGYIKKRGMNESLKAYNEERKMYAQEHGYRHRDHGSSAKYVRWQEVYERDNGVCWICGELVDVNDFERIGNYFKAGPMFPSADHVIPMSKGGAGDSSNIRLAHMICNSRKGSKVF